jgi:hypothetical protein
VQLANRHSYVRAARVGELALIAVLFTAFVMLFGALFVQLV